MHGTKTRSARIGVKRLRGYYLVFVGYKCHTTCCTRKSRRTRCRNDKHDNSTNPPRQANFAMGCVKIRIDSHSSYCVSPSKADFVGPLLPFRATVRGIGDANIKVKYKGTVRWYWHDDQGRISHIMKYLIHSSSPRTTKEFWHHNIGVKLNQMTMHMPL